MNGTNDDVMITEIISLTSIKKTNVITSKKVLVWAQKSGGSKSTKSANGGNKENKYFDAVRRHEKNNNAFTKAKASRRATCNNYKYCGNGMEVPSLW